jgi:hypothetical protein
MVTMKNIPVKIEPEGSLNEYHKGGDEHLVSRQGLYRSAVLVIIYLLATATVSAGEESADTSSLYASLGNYSHISKSGKVMQKDKSETDIPALETTVKIGSYSLGDNKYIYPDTPFGDFFRELSEKTKSQIEVAKKDSMYCGNDHECNYYLSREQGNEFGDSAMDSFLHVLKEESEVVSYPFAAMKKVETYFTAYIDPDEGKIYNPILAHFKSDNEENEEKVRRGKNKIKFVLKYMINKGPLGEIEIPTKVVDMYLRHEITIEKTKIIMKFPFYENLKLEFMRKTNNYYAGTVQISFSIEGFEEAVQNLFNPGQGVM